MHHLISNKYIHGKSLCYQKLPFWKVSIIKVSFSVWVPKLRKTYSICFLNIFLVINYLWFCLTLVQLDKSLLNVYTHQILQGLDSIHQYEFIHSKFSSKNLLVAETRTLKISCLRSLIKAQQDKLANMSVSDIYASYVYWWNVVLLNGKYGLDGS